MMLKLLKPTTFLNGPTKGGLMVGRFRKDLLHIHKYIDVYILLRWALPHPNFLRQPNPTQPNILKPHTSPPRVVGTISLSTPLLTNITHLYILLQHIYLFTTCCKWLADQCHCALNDSHALMNKLYYQNKQNSQRLTNLKMLKIY